MRENERREEVGKNKTRRQTINRGKKEIKRTNESEREEAKKKNGK